MSRDASDSMQAAATEDTVCSADLHVVLHITADKGNEPQAVRDELIIEDGRVLLYLHQVYGNGGHLHQHHPAGLHKVPSSEPLQREIIDLFSTDMACSISTLVC